LSGVTHIAAKSLQRRVGLVVHLQHVLADREDARSLRAPLACTAAADGVRVLLRPASYDSDSSAELSSTHAQRSGSTVAKTLTLLLRTTVRNNAGLL